MINNFKIFSVFAAFALLLVVAPTIALAQGNGAQEFKIPIKEAIFSPCEGINEVVTLVGEAVAVQRIDPITGGFRYLFNFNFNGVRGVGFDSGAAYHVLSHVNSGGTVEYDGDTNQSYASRFRVIGKGEQFVVLVKYHVLIVDGEVKINIFNFTVECK